MKYSFSSFYTWGSRIMTSLSFGMAAIIYFMFNNSKNGLDVSWWCIISISFLGVFVFMYYLTFFPKIVIDAKGVRGRYLFRDYKPMKWSEIKEVGIGCHNDFALNYNWIYFSKEPLKEEEKRPIGKTRKALKIRYSKRALNVVRVFYQGEIVGLKENTKPQNFIWKM